MCYLFSDSLIWKWVGSSSYDINRLVQLVINTNDPADVRSSVFEPAVEVHHKRHRSGHVLFRLSASCFGKFWKFDTEIDATRRVISTVKRNIFRRCFVAFDPRQVESRGVISSFY